MRRILRRDVAGPPLACDEPRRGFASCSGRTRNVANDGAAQPGMLYIAAGWMCSNVRIALFRHCTRHRLHAKVAARRRPPCSLCMASGVLVLVAPATGGFRRDYRCVAIDLRGFNLSSQPVEERHRAALVGDLVAVIRCARGPGTCGDRARLGRRGALEPGGSAARLMHKFVIINSPHAILFAHALAHDAAQIEASLYMNWLRRPGAESVLAEDNFARLLAMLDSMSDDEREGVPQLLAPRFDRWLQLLPRHHRCTPIPRTSPAMLSQWPPRLGRTVSRHRAHPDHLGHRRHGTAPDPARRHPSATCRTCACTTLKAPATGWRGSGRTRSTCAADVSGEHGKIVPIQPRTHVATSLHSAPMKTARLAHAFALHLASAEVAVSDWWRSPGTHQPVRRGDRGSPVDSR